MEILFFVWMALLQPFDKVDSEQRDHMLSILEEHCESLHPDAELTVWWAPPRKHEFRYYGEVEKGVYSGRDLVCVINLNGEDQ